MSRTIESLKYAAELVRRPAMYGNFLITNMGDSPHEKAMGAAFARELLNTPDEVWVKGMAAAFRNKAFSQLVRKVVEKGQKKFTGATITLKLENGKELPEDDPVMLAIRRTASSMGSAPDDPRWEALVLFGFARMIGTTARIQYRLNEWTEFTFLALTSEKSFLLGDGKAFAKDILKYNTHSKNDLATIMADRLKHALVEAALQDGHKTRFFQERVVVH